jgi:DNA repair exonuclease SbcCD ATPase subunit
MENPKLLHSILEALLDELGYRGPKKTVDEILPQLHTQSRRRLESTEAKSQKLQHHTEALSAQASAIASEVSGIQESVSQKFRDLHRLLDEKEAQFKEDVSELASEVAHSITEQEQQCQRVVDELQAEAQQLESALRQESELGFISGIANMPKHELEIDAALLKVPTVNFEARASLNSEPIREMIEALQFNVQQVRLFIII